MKTVINGKEFAVKETNGKYFYWSPRAFRWLRISKANVVFE